MGFGTYGGGYKFANVANGKMHMKVGDEKKEFDYFDGQLVGIQIIEDTYEEKPLQKVELTLANGEKEKVKLKFTLEAWYSVGFFARIAKIDLTKQFRLGVFQSEKNEKVSFCYMKQGEKKIEADKTIPRPVKKTLGKKVVDDWTDFDTFVDKMIEKLTKQLNPAGVLTVQDDTVPPPTDSDLPF
jgi:predicted DNA-binding antitoxin AbrB/MazE fold protein